MRKVQSSACFSERRTMVDDRMSAAIFCGGKSRRMGRDKALLPVDQNRKETFVGLLVEKLAGFGDLWLSIGQEESYPQVPVRKISDRYPDAGPMGGLESVLTVCRHDILFVTAVDIPFADRDLAWELYEKMQEDPSLDALLMLDGQGRKQPLLGLYRKSVLPLLSRRLEEKSRQESGRGEIGNQKAGSKGESGKEETAGRENCGRKDRAYQMKDFLKEIRVAYVPADQVRDGERKTLSCNNRKEYQDLMARIETGLHEANRQETALHEANRQETDLHEANRQETMPADAAKDGVLQQALREYVLTDSGRIPVVSVTGWSGSGKTTFLEKLIPCLKRKGLRVACLKHDAHHFEVDKEGKDSYRLTRAGADMTGLFSRDKGVWMENRPVDLNRMFRSVHDVDLILLEGGSETIFPKILVYREALGRGMRVPPEDCLAVISDDPAPGALRQFSFDETEQAAAFLAAYCRDRG